MNILSLFSFAIFAAESLISPLTSDYQVPIAELSKPTISFAELPVPTPSPTPSPTPQQKADPPLAETPLPVQTTKKSIITIALLGDSMMDTLGPDAPHLANALKKTYPNTTFIIKNLGVGGKPINDGIDRITNGYTYLGTSYPPLMSQNPDVVVLESFGYNATGTGQGAIDHHWLELARAVDVIKSNLPNAKVVIAATIAPNSTRFGDGAPGLAFSSEDKQKRTTNIKQYIETAIKFAKSEHIPLANAYDASLDGSDDGKLAYINSGDHIHYSDAGRTLMGSKIAGAIVGNKLLE